MFPHVAKGMLWMYQGLWAKMIILGYLSRWAQWSHTGDSQTEKETVARHTEMKVMCFEGDKPRPDVGGL